MKLQRIKNLKKTYTPKEIHALIREHFLEEVSHKTDIETADVDRRKVDVNFSINSEYKISSVQVTALEGCDFL